MDLTWERNKVLSSNVANAETPMYRAKDLNFAGELERAFGTSTGEHLTLSNPKHVGGSESSGSHLFSDLSGTTKPDGNNVDIDLQMGQMSRNSSQYSLAAQLVRKKLQMMREAIRYGQA